MFIIFKQMNLDLNIACVCYKYVFINIFLTNILLAKTTHRINIVLFSRYFFFRSVYSKVYMCLTNMETEVLLQRLQMAENAQNTIF